MQKVKMHGGEAQVAHTLSLTSQPGNLSSSLKYFVTGSAHGPWALALSHPTTREGPWRPSVKQPTAQ